MRYCSSCMSLVFLAETDAEKDGHVERGRLVAIADEAAVRLFPRYFT